MYRDDYSWDLIFGDREVEDSGDILNISRSELFQVENAEFFGAKCLTVSTALDCSRDYVRGECLCLSSPLVSSWSPLLGVLFRSDVR